MPERYKILVINPGSTSTKMAIFSDEKIIFEETIRYSTEHLSNHKKIVDQFGFRKKDILNVLENTDINIRKVDAVVARGGLLKPIPGGTYEINDKMLEHLRIGYSGEHASNLGGLIAADIAKNLGIRSFIVDPVVVDEMDPLAKLSGIPEITRKSIFHALNQKAVARKASKDLGKKYENCNLVIAHLGGGISVGAHLKGKVVDVNNALDGDGPFSPERSGGLPFGDLIKLCYSGKYTEQTLKKRLIGNGGLVAYLNTNDGKEVSERINKGDKKAELIYRGMAYQVSKEIASLSAVLKGKIDGVIITGGLAYDKKFVEWIKERVEFLAPFLVYPGEAEMLALAQGALRVLRGEETAKVYD